MKRSYRPCSIFIVTVLLVFSLVTSACQPLPQTQHTHTYSKAWTSDETFHWHKATCGDDGISGYAAHSYDNNGRCTVCGYEREALHEHAWYSQWSYDNSYHWHASLCGDTDEVRDKSEHSIVNSACTLCDYKQNKPHEHAWHSEWSQDYTYHWRAPLCSDTEEIKDKAKHSYVNFVCEQCGFDQTPDYAHIPRTDFADMGDRFSAVAAPLYNAAQTILGDLADSGDVTLNSTRNQRITGIRYFYGRSLIIVVREDVNLWTDNEKSEFLQHEFGITLENFGQSYDEAYLAYRNFLCAERKSQSRDNYEEFMLPYAEKSAQMLLAQYNAYKSKKEITIDNYGKQLILSSQSSLASVYGGIVANLNSALKEKGYPLITNQDLNIGFGGNRNWEISCRWILIQANINNLHYRFYLSFNHDGEFTEDYLNYYMGTLWTGYEHVNPDLLNPPNEKYSELFERLKIEEIDLSNIENSYKYQGEGNGLYGPGGEDTFLYF